MSRLFTWLLVYCLVFCCFTVVVWFMKNIILIAFAIFSSGIGISQITEGPGGIDVTGLELWLKPENIVPNAGDGSFVTGWTDVSPGNHDVGAGTTDDDFRPTLKFEGFNGHNSIVFDGSDDFLGGAIDYSSNPIETKTVFIAFRSNGSVGNSTLECLWGYESDGAYISAEPRSSKFTFSVNGTGGQKGVASLNGEAYGATPQADPNLVTRWVYDSIQIVAVQYQNRQDLNKHMLGDLGRANQNLGGEVAEVIVYNRDLSEDVEKLRVTNYLTEKYGVKPIANEDHSNYDVSYPDNQLVLGFEVNEFRSNVGDGDAIYLDLTAGNFDNNDFVNISNNGEVHDATSNDVTDSYSRWTKVYKVIKNDANASMTEVELSFGTIDAGFGNNNANGAVATDYALYFRSGPSGDFSVVAGDPVLDVDLNKVTFTLTNAELQDGYYTLGVPPGRTWYTYLVNGSWTDPIMWTLDGSGTLYENAASELPGTTDRVVILNGKTVDVDVDDVEVLSLTVNQGGIIDFNTRTGQAATIVKGAGTIRLSADNYITANTDDDFTSSGKVEFHGSGYEISTDYSFYNVDINMDNASDVIIFDADLNVGGDLIIENGEMQLGANSPSVQNYDIDGNLYIQSTGKLDVSDSYTGDARQLTLYLAGDFTNEGTAIFSDVSTVDDAGTEAHVKVDVRFDNSSGNQKVYLDGVTEFYRIVSDKGSDATYLLEIEATNTANFKLLGKTSGGGSTLGTGENDNALGLKSGTVKLGKNIFIDELKTATGNYDIPLSCELWIANAEVEMDGQYAMVVYGSLRVSEAGSKLTIRSGSGITLRNLGAFIVEDGTVLVNQVRRSTNSGIHYGAFKQSGGLVKVADMGLNTPNSNFHLFELSEESQTFEMTGGTLHIVVDSTGDDGTKGPLFINSDPEYINVSGGTVIIEATGTETDAVNLSSRAEFPDLIFRNSGTNTREFDFNGRSGYNQASDPVNTIVDPTLKVTGAFIIEDEISFDHNGQNIELGGDLMIYPTSTLVYDDVNKQNTLTVNGSGNRTLLFDNVTTGNPQNIYRFEVAVDNATDTVFIAGSNVDTTDNVDASRANDLLQINKALYHREGVFDQQNFSVVLHCDTIYNTGVTFGDRNSGNTATDPNSYNDRIRFMDYDNNQTAIYFYQSQDARWGTVDLDLDSDYLDLDNDFRRFDRFYFKSGRVNMNQHRVQVGNIIEIFNGRAEAGTWSKDDMFVAGGRASDLGMGINWGKSNTFPKVYPVGLGLGVNARYTPFTVEEAVAGTTNRTHYLTVVDDTLRTTNINGGDILSMYWRMEYGWNGTEGSLPTVNIKANYDDGDIDGGDESAFVGGRVLEAIPFTRAELGTVDASINEITYLGVSVDTSASYTAGKAERFDLKLEIFYSRGPGNTTTLWSEVNSWSNEGHYDLATVATQSPTEGSIVIIGFNPNTDASGSNAMHRVEMDVNANVSAVYLERNTVKDENGDDYDRTQGGEPRLTILNTIDDAGLGFVDGRGEVVLEVGCSPCSPDPDITVLKLPVVRGDFDVFGGGGNSDWNIFEYNLIMPANTVGKLLSGSVPKIYPRLDINGNNTTGQAIIFEDDLDVRSRLRFYNDGSLWLNDGDNGDITVEQGIRFFGGNSDSYLKFQDKGTARTLTCKEIFTMQSSNHKMFVENDESAGLEHRFVYGLTERNDRYMDIDDGQIDFYVDNVTSSVVFDVQNYESTIIYGKETNVSDFNRLIVNSNDTTTLTVTTDFELGGTANGSADSKSLVLNSGKLVLDNTGLDLDISTGGDEFLIPSNAHLELMAGNLNILNSGMRLDGELTIAGGTLDMASDNLISNIIYTVSSESSLTLTEGNLLVGGSIMRPIDDDQATLKYTQSGGQARFGINGYGSTDRGVFDLVGADSEYIRSGGSFTIESGNTSSLVGALHIDGPGVFSESGTSTIQIDAPGTEVSIFTASDVGGNQGIKLNELQIVDASAKVIVNDLQVNDIIVELGASLNGNNLNVEVCNSWVNNDGVNGFDAGGDDAFFITSGTTVQMTGKTNFNHFNNETSSALNLTTGSTELTAVDFRNESTIIAADNDINITGNLVNPGKMWATTGYVNMNGSSAQTISSEGTGGVTFADFSNLRIDNSSGVSSVRYLGKRLYIRVYADLELSEGVFAVGDDFLVLFQNATVSGNDFGPSKMIRSNGSGASLGIYLRLAGGSTRNLLVPIGVSNIYTPVELNLINSDVAYSDIILKPINSQHTTTVSTTYSQELLDYYWRLIYTRNTEGLTGDITFQYDQSLVHSVEDDYGSAKFKNGDWLLSVNDVDIVNNQFTATVENPTSKSTIDYTCGNTIVTSPKRTFPLTVPEYWSVVPIGDIGDWEDPNTWERQDNNLREVPEEGSVVKIQSGDTVNITQNGVNVYNLTIDGELQVGTTLLHNLGVVDGTGVIELESGQFPGGSFDDFLTTTGGVVEYAGSGTYKVSTQVNAARGLIFSGTGTREIPYLSATIGDSILIDGVTVDNTIENAGFDLEGDLAIRNGGVFKSGTGGINFVGAKNSYIRTKVSQESTLAQLTIDKTEGDLIIEGDSVVVKSFVGFDKGRIITNDNTFYMEDNVSFSHEPWDSSYVQGNACIGISNNGEFEFPVGDDYLYASSAVHTISPAGDWCSAFHYTNPTNDGYDVLKIKDETDKLTFVNPLGYWGIHGVENGSIASGGISLSWSFDNTNPYDNASDAAVAEWDADEGTDGSWYNKGGAFNDGTFTLRSDNGVTFSKKQFTFASIGIKPLPVELLFVKAKVIKSGVELQWATVSELDNDKFVIERSFDLVNFENIGEIAGNGTTGSRIDYEFVDSDFQKGTIYYRLKQIDFNGDFEYSKVVAVLVENNREIVGETIEDEVYLTVYPNPSTSGEVITFEFINTDESSVYLELYDMKGECVYKESMSIGEGQIYTLESDLDVGLYIAKVLIHDTTIIKRIVIQ